MIDLDKDTVYLMVHADDAGLCHSENRATIECLENGSVNSCSVMVNCSGFEEMAGYLKDNPGFDHGIHLTLTCEWHRNRFGPVLDPAEVPSLVDDQGYFYKNRRTLLKNANPEDVLKEVRAQIQKGIDHGLQPSHLDSHMYSLGISPILFNIYREAGKEFELPVLSSSTLLSEVSGSDPTEILRKEDFDIPRVHYGDYSDFERGQLDAFYLETLKNLEPGLHMILIHPAYDDQEMQELTYEHPNFGSAWRQVDTDFFTSDLCKQTLADKSVQMVTWKDLKKRF